MRITRFLLTRIAGMIGVLLLVSLATFLIFYLLPADPARTMCGKLCLPGELDQVRAFMGLNEPVWRQYLNFLGGLFTGRTYGSGANAIVCAAPCLGYSFQQNTTVLSLVGQTLPVTASIAVGAAVLWLVAGVLAGVVAALRHGRLTDRGVMAVAIIGVSAPSYLVGLLAILLFGFKLNVLPDSGYVPLGQNPGQWAFHLILPWCVLAFISAAIYARLTRSQMLEALGEDYVRTARAKGLRESSVVGRHALRNVLIPVITMFGLDFGVLLGGAVITEKVFSMYGLGALLIGAVNSTDLSVISGVTLLAATFVIVANFVVDVVYKLLDPRVLRTSDRKSSLMRKHVTILGSSVSVAVLAAGIAACGGANSTTSSPAAASAPAAKGGTLTVLDSETTISGLDPALSWSLDTTMSGLMFRRLTTWKIGPTGTPEVVPDLATSDGTPSDGGRVWTYHLKSGIHFSNGQPITSSDVKYGIERTYAPALTGGLNYQKPLIAGGAGYTGPFGGKQLSSIVTPNATTIVFHLNQPYGDWPWVVSTTSMAPVPAGKAPAATFGKAPVTSGPYAVQSYKSGNSLVLVRNKFWSQASDPNRTAGPDKIVFELNQDPTVEAQSLISDGPSAQDAFGADFVPPAQLAQAENNPSVKSRLVTSSASPLEYLSVNMQSPKLKSLQARQALEYAVNRQAVVYASGGSVAADPATTLITPGIAGRVNYDLYPAGSTGDPAKAKSLLAAAGVKNLTLTLATMNDPISTAISQAVQEAYKQAGISVVIKPMDQNSFFALVTGNGASGYDLALSSWQPDFPSAMDNIEPLFASGMIGNGNYNISRLSDSHVDTLMSQAEGTVSQTTANALWAQADKAVLSDAAVVPLVYNKNSFLRGSNVQDFYIGEFPAYPVYTAVTLGQ